MFANITEKFNPAAWDLFNYEVIKQGYRLKINALQGMIERYVDYKISAKNA